MTRSTAAKLPQMSHGRYVPEVGNIITVELPGERTRATIERVISDEAVIAKLQTFTTSKEHDYRKGDLVPCRFTDVGMGATGWLAISERQLDQASAKKTKKGA